jgi:plasmid maintenance system antidote protein VapI
MLFETLHRRLVERINDRVRNGEITERKLARITGISQPHVHNLLKGARGFSPESADCMLRNLNMSVVDLLEPVEIEELSHRAEISRAGQLPDRFRGPAAPFPPN